MIDIAIDIVSWVLLTLGGACVLIGGIGALRLPNFYTRIHAASLTDTMATILIFVGMMLQAGLTLAALKLAAIMLFLLLTGPTATYALANAALLSGLKPDADTIVGKIKTDARMIFVFALFLLTLLVITAIAIVRSENLFVSVMLTSIFSLLMAANFFILDAADVALTEAAVGAGITTVIFLSALALTAEREKRRAGGQLVALGAVGIMAALIIYATFDKPRLGDPEAPVHQHVAPWYLEKTPEYIDIPNVVTAILSSYRGYDTLGEVFVVFTACIGVLFILGVKPPEQPADRTAESGGLRHHLIPQVVGRLLVPFIVLFGLYTQFHGEYGPGGGFQAGAIIATGVILYALLEGEGEALRAVPRSVLLGLVVGGALLFGGVGILCMLMGGAFLDYSVLSADPVWGQQLGIIVIEAGVGMAVCGALLSIFHAFAARQSHR